MKFFHRFLIIFSFLVFSGPFNGWAQIPPTALIRVQITFGASIDETIVYLHPLATDTFDQDTYDVPKLYSTVDGVPNVMTLLNRNGPWVKLATNGFQSPMTPGCLKVPLGTRTTADGNYTLTITEFFGFDSMNIFVSLIDNRPGDTIPFQTLGQEYNFAALNGDSTRGRFILYFCQDYPVGVSALPANNSKPCSTDFWKSAFYPVSEAEKNNRVEVFDLFGKALFQTTANKFSEWSKQRNFTEMPVILKVTSEKEVCYKKFVLHQD